MPECNETGCSADATYVVTRNAPEEGGYEFIICKRHMPKIVNHIMRAPYGMAVVRHVREATTTEPGSDPAPTTEGTP